MKINGIYVVLILVIFSIGTIFGGAAASWYHQDMHAEMVGLYENHMAEMHDDDLSDGEYTVEMETIETSRINFLAYRDAIQNTMRDDSQYRCCLDNPCTYCIEKTPGHGEGAACDCLADVMNGEHPCGECIGEILEGHGNEYIAMYFAQAIAAEVGQEHIDSLRQIIASKYDIPVSEQL